MIAAPDTVRTRARGLTSVARPTPELDAHVELAGGRYPLGEGDQQRWVDLRPVLIGRWPVVNGHVRAFVESTSRAVGPALAAKLGDPQLVDHPATDVSLDDAIAFCAWAGDQLGRPVRLPTGAEWEVVARGGDRRPWPWGTVFDAGRCACIEAGWGWTVSVTAHPAGASPFGAEQLSGNVWEWVSDRTPDGWGVVRGGCYLDHAWGVRAARALPADPARPTATTGFRIAIEADDAGTRA